MIEMPNRTMEAPELETMLEALREEPGLWRERVRFDAEDRVSVSIGGNEHVEVWLICWAAGQSTGMHDHEASHGAAVVVDGSLREDLLGASGPIASATFGPGSRMRFPAGHIHDMTQVGEAPAVTLHAYSPPLGFVGKYDLAEGVLRREAVERDQAARYTAGWDTSHQATAGPA